MQDHRKLRVWKRSHELAIAVRRANREFPRVGYGALRSQITRAAESIVFNIVEGCGTASQRERARFLDISIKSTMELEAQLELAKDYGALRPATWMVLSHDAIDVRRMLCGLRAKVLSSLHTERSLLDATNRKTNSEQRETQDVDPGSPTEGHPRGIR